MQYTIGKSGDALSHSIRLTELSMAPIERAGLGRLRIAICIDVNEVRRVQNC